MPAEYFSTVHLIWVNIVLFIFSLFLFGVCLYACLFVRWVYKRRLRQKTDLMIDAYKNAETKQTEAEVKKLEEKPKKKKAKKRVHIVTKACNQVIKKNRSEFIVRKVNERGDQACPPMAAPQQMQQQHQPPQFIVVPYSMGTNQKQIKKQYKQTQSPGVPVVIPMPQKMLVESVATQTSDRGEQENGVVRLEKKQSDPDWLAGFDERDGEKVVVEEAPISERVMKKRQTEEKSKSGRKKRNVHPKARDVDEARCSIENDTPTHQRTDSVPSPPLPAPPPPTPATQTTTPAPPTSVTQAPTPAIVSDSTTPSVTASVPPLSEKTGSTYVSASASSKTSPPKKSKGPSSGSGNSSVYSVYLGDPNVAPPKAPASRPSIFPYFVDSKAPAAEVTSGKAVAKLTEPSVLESSGSSVALYSESHGNSKKMYNKVGTPKK